MKQSSDFILIKLISLKISRLQYLLINFLNVYVKNVNHHVAGIDLQGQPGL
jgi:hypothetical protein